jgi:sporulation protein YqfC
MEYKDKIIESMGIPKEILSQYPKITITGETDITVENIKGIIEYTTDLLKINTYLYIIKINGEGLLIDEITSKIISVKGKIKSVELI